MSRIIDMMIGFLCSKERRFSYLSRLGVYNHMSDEEYLKKKFKMIMGYEMNLENPITFNEKLQWLKIHDRRPEYTQMVDKYRAKKYVASVIGKEYIIPTLGVWEHFDDIDFETLPNQFVLKCTHDSGGLVIVRDKSAMDIRAAKKKIEKSLKRNYFYSNREWPYKDVNPRIIAEKNMTDGENELVDYKFYIFNGKFRFLYVSQGLENHATAKISFLTPKWEFASFRRKDYAPFVMLPPKPVCYEKMIELAETLAQGIPFLRVDFYEVGGKIYFGELTFSPCAGFMPFCPQEYDVKIGAWLNLPC